MNYSHYESCGICHAELCEHALKQAREHMDGILGLLPRADPEVEARIDALHARLPKAKPVRLIREDSDHYRALLRLAQAVKDSDHGHGKRSILAEQNCPLCQALAEVENAQ